MKRLIAVLLLLCAVSFAQVPTTNGGSFYEWGKVTDTGQVGSYLVQPPLPFIPSVFTIDWSVAGTAPAACTYRIEGSSDGTNWYGLDVTAPDSNSVACTSSNMIHIVNRPVRYLRVYIVAYTAGDATTSVKFHYTAGI